jgi:hypothetical protein
MHEHPTPRRGRGAPANPPNRFEPLSYGRDPEWNELEDPALETQFFKDTSRSIITYNDSPDRPTNTWDSPPASISSPRFW